MTTYEIEKVLHKFVTRCKYGVSSSDISLAAQEIAAKVAEATKEKDVTEKMRNKTIGVDAFCAKLDEIFKTGMITKAQIIDAYNESVDETMPTEEEVLQYFNNHFNCYADVTIGDYQTTELAMTNVAVLKMFEWFSSRMNSSEKPNNSEGVE